MRIEDFPDLEGWVSFPDAAVTLGVARQRINQLAEEDKLRRSEVRKVRGSGERPAVLLVSTAAVGRLVAERDAAEAARAASEQQRAERQAAQASAA